MPQRVRGFTLLELLVVMVLIGIVLSLVVTGLTAGPAQQARQQASELLSLLIQLRDTAVAEGQEYGLSFDDHGYRLKAWQDGQWLNRSDWRLPDGMWFRLELESKPLHLGRRGDEPQLLILSSDEMSAFTLHYETAHGRWLSIYADGVNDPVINEG